MRWVIIVAVVSVLPGCQKNERPARGSGVVAVQLDAVRHSEGKTVPVDFGARVARALGNAGFTVADGGAAGLMLRGTANVEDEHNADSKVGGPVAFYFVQGSYDLELLDAGGAKLGVVQGPIDLRSMGADALQKADKSFEASTDLAMDAAADRLARQVVELGSKR